MSTSFEPSASAVGLTPPARPGADADPPAAGAAPGVASRSGGLPEPGRGRERVAAGAAPDGAGAPTLPPRPAPPHADDDAEQAAYEEYLAGKDEGGVP